MSEGVSEGGGEGGGEGVSESPHRKYYSNCSFEHCPHSN